MNADELTQAMRLLETYMVDEPDGGGFTIESFKRGGLAVTIRKLSPDGRFMSVGHAGAPSMDELPAAISMAVIEMGVARPIRVI